MRVEALRVDGELLRGEILDAGKRAHAEGIITPIIYGLTLAPAAGHVKRMSLYALGLNHQIAPLPVRQRLGFHLERLREALPEMKRGHAHEGAVVQTWNP